MEQPEEIIQLLAEIRDLQREHLAELKRARQESIELYRAAADKANVQYKQSVDSSMGFTWALLILIAVLVCANLVMLATVGGSK